MAWRIDQHVVRGEIDNRVRGRVTGRIWFAGRDEPVELDLAGNAWRDLAGRCIEFSNAQAEPGLPESFATNQTGPVGDLTASRKVRVPDIPLEQVGEYYARREKFPWHWGNSVYFEWYSATNGRVVIESANYVLRLREEIGWEMTEADEHAQREANATAMQTFMNDLLAAGGEIASGAESDGAFENEPEEEGEENGKNWTASEGWSERPPLSEKEADAFLDDSDRLVDRVHARMEAAGENADFEQIMKEELERRQKERGDKPLTPEEEAERSEWIEAMNRAAEDAATDPDLENECDFDRKHPLAERAFELGSKVMSDIDDRGWAPEGASEEHPIIELVASISKMSGKLAAALDGRDWPPDLDECGLCIAWLKRARRFGTDAASAADCCAEENLLDAGWLTPVREELVEVLAAIDRLLEELRARMPEA